MQGIVTHETDRGFVFAETTDHRNIFIHAKEVLGSRVLHVNDRVEMDIVESPRHPGKFEGRNVQYLGHMLNRQVSEQLSAKSAEVLGTDAPRAERKKLRAARMVEAEAAHAALDRGDNETFLRYVRKAHGEDCRCANCSEAIERGIPHDPSFAVAPKAVSDARR